MAQIEQMKVGSEKTHLLKIVREIDQAVRKQDQNQDKEMSRYLALIYSSNQ